MTQVPDTAGTDPLGSLDELADLVEVERQAQRRALDSMDTKAGVVIGFAAATSALAERGGLLLLPGVAIAAVSAVLALLAFLPQPGIHINPARLRRAHLHQPARVTRFDLLIQKSAAVEHAGQVLRVKTLRLQLALWALLTAVVLLLAGTMIASLTGQGGTP